MADKTETTNTAVMEHKTEKQPVAPAAEFSLSYILEQLAAIRQQTDYLQQALTALADMPNGDSGAQGAPGNIQGKAKAEALADVVRSREDTNQRLMRLYEKMYDDLQQHRSVQDRALDALEWAQAQGRDAAETLSDVLDIIRHLE